MIFFGIFLLKVLRAFVELHLWIFRLQYFNHKLNDTFNGNGDASFALSCIRSSFSTSTARIYILEYPDPEG